MVVAKPFLEISSGSPTSQSCRGPWDVRIAHLALRAASNLQDSPLYKMQVSPCPDCDLVSKTQHEQFDLWASPVASFLDSNQRPSAAELKKVAKEVQRSSLELSICDEEIKHLEAHLQDLKRHRSTVSRYINAHKAVTSPIRRVPPEILAVIMKLAVSGQQLQISSPENLRKHGLWLLALVSRSWRDIALSLPDLWSVIEISNETAKWQNGIRVLEVVLERSKQAPLMFKLELDGVRAENHVLDAICSHSDRWKHATISSTIKALEFMSCVRGALPQLSRLEISLTMQDAGLTPIDAFCSAPNLHCVRLGNCSPQHFDLPWSQLKSFECRGGIAKGLQVLHQMDDLEDLNLQYAGPPLENHLQLPRLKSMRCYCRTGFLDCLTLPALESATFNFHNFNVPGYLSLITRSSCTLKSLELVSHLNGSQLLALLRHHPSLHTFNISFVNHDAIDVFSQALTISRTQPNPYLPRLRILEVHNMELNDGFLKMIESRSSAFVGGVDRNTRHGVRLESLVLHLDRRPRTDQLLRLDRVLQSGISVAMKL
ncbi:hypothetical protein HGRIS_005581 [Hohenbuehelia grisea]|uniref:F-box domain-containing protein n=1 Tax=Hohenbuehelia grisea TaxID=104357 RepID=A0ABR3JX93_9AGAR